MSTAVRIVKSPEVLHGKPHVEGSRVGVFTVGELVRRNGWTVEDIVAEFDLDQEEARAAIEYYDEHPELMETLRAQKEANRDSVREESRAE